MLPAKHTFEAIGTAWSIDTEQPLGGREREQIERAIEEFDAVYSRFRDDSLVSKVRAEGPGEYSFPESIVRIYDLYLALEKVSSGAINPLAGMSLERLGYDAVYSLTNHAELPYVPPRLSDTVHRNGRELQFDQSLLLDIGAIGKGYLIDRIAKIVAERHAWYVVDGSGDIAVHTAEPETIGLEDPRNTGRIIGAAHLRAKSICASATNRRAWGEGLHHIIDARTGMPTESDVIASWVVADTTILADALTTGLFFAPAQALRDMFGAFEYVILRKDGSVEHSIIGAAFEIYT